MPEHMLHLTEPALAQVGRRLEAQSLPGRLLTKGPDDAIEKAPGDSLEAALLSSAGPAFTSHTGGRISRVHDREWTDCGDPVLAAQRRLCLSRHGQ